MYLTFEPLHVPYVRMYSSRNSFQLLQNDLHRVATDQGQFVETNNDQK